MQTTPGCGRQWQQLTAARVEGLCPLQVRVSGQEYRQPPSSTSFAPSFHTWHEAMSLFKDGFEPSRMVSTLSTAPRSPWWHWGSPRVAQAAKGLQEMQQGGDMTALGSSFVTASGIVFDRGKKKWRQGTSKHQTY